MYRDHSVAVVVPAYNEEGFVGDVLDDVPGFVDRIYVVDDRSTDGTWAEILRHTVGSPTAAGDEPLDDVVDVETWDGNRVVERPSTRPVGTRTDGGATPSAAATRVVPIQHAENRGVGAAITTGYRRARDDGVDVTAVMAGDGQMDPDNLDRLLDPLVEGRADYAKGNRLLDQEFYEGMSGFRLFGNYLLSFLTKVASGYWDLLDPQNGYTAISLDALETVDLDACYEDYGFSNDLLVRLNAHGFRVADVAMPAVYGDEVSHIEYRSFVPRLSWLLLERFLYRLRVKYLVTDFHPLALLYGLGTLGVAGALAGLAWAVATRENADSTAGTVLSAAILAVVSTACLFLAMTFDRAENEGLVVTIR